MSNLDNLIGFLSAIMAFLTMLFSPVIYDSYFKYFKLSESVGYQMCIAFALILMIIGFIVLSIYHLQKKINE